MHVFIITGIIFFLKFVGVEFKILIQGQEFLSIGSQKRCRLF